MATKNLAERYLKVESFLGLKSVYLPLGRLNILIGPQAQGKSVLAKLVHFFQSTISNEARAVLGNDHNISEARSAAKERFEEIFPKYAWLNDSFNIEYVTPLGAITISRQAMRSTSPAKLEFSEELIEFFEKAKEAIDQEKSENEYRVLFKSRKVNKYLNDLGPMRPFFATSNFIPAGRSFFSNLERNIFSLIVSRLEIDPLIAEFGSNYEIIRSNLQLIRQGGSVNISSRKNQSWRYDAGKGILNGIYVRQGEDDFIESSGRRVRLLHSSSGQQEVLPLLLTLWAGGPDGPLRNSAGRSLVIEEPEAHLFPSAQRDVVSLLAGVLKEDEQSSLFITTHSPYVLAAANNLLYAGGLKSRYPNEEGKINKITKGDLSINADDTQAFYVMGGKLESLIDRELGIVKAEKIDEISDAIGQEMDGLLELGHSLGD